MADNSLSDGLLHPHYFRISHWLKHWKELNEVIPLPLFPYCLFLLLCHLNSHCWPLDCGRDPNIKQPSRMISFNLQVPKPHVTTYTLFSGLTVRTVPKNCSEKKNPYILIKKKKKSFLSVIRKNKQLYIYFSRFHVIFELSIYFNGIWSSSEYENTKTRQFFIHLKPKAYIQSSQFSHPTFDAWILQSSCLYSLTSLKQVSWKTRNYWNKKTMIGLKTSRGIFKAKGWSNHSVKLNTDIIFKNSDLYHNTTVTEKRQINMKLFHMTFL